ncbi:MAG: hypothetical protein IKW03_03125, partial [Clostridia bacterium]|nr:hypothetical protein [Clostridia bacterium]
ICRISLIADEVLISFKIYVKPLVIKQDTTAENKRLVFYNFKLWGAFLRVSGERLNGIQEVKSSILSVSTTHTEKP